MYFWSEGTVLPIARIIEPLPTNSVQLLGVVIEERCECVEVISDLTAGN
jgi:hypothetical protein